MKPSSLAPAYVAFYPVLTDIARKHGYALAVHGTVSRDFDLVAVPWIDEAVPVETLVKAIANYASEVMSLMFDLPTELKSPTQKPHGRLSWVIQIGAGSYIDLSVMPPLLSKDESQ